MGSWLADVFSRTVWAWLLKLSSISLMGPSPPALSCWRGRFRVAVCMMMSSVAVRPVQSVRCPVHTLILTVSCREHR